jgi:predicted RNase H-like HicB family nuclease
MDEYRLEIDELHDDVVVLIVPALRLLVFGRTLDEALTRARAAIGLGLVERGRRPDPSLTFPHEPSDTGQQASPAAA